MRDPTFVVFIVLVGAMVGRWYFSGNRNFRAAYGCTWVEFLCSVVLAALYSYVAALTLGGLQLFFAALWIFLSVNSWQNIQTFRKLRP